MLKRVLASTAIASLAGVSGAFAQYPVKPVTMVVPYAAGGPTDTVARVMGVAIDKLVVALQDSLKDETVKKRFADLGAEVVPLNMATPAALEAHLKSEIAKWGPIIKKAGVYAD